MLGDDETWNVAYCPERIVQGYAVRELVELPQIVAGMTERAAQNAAELFSRVSPKVIRVSIEEAELVKLFTNTWRYIQFAITNQFYMIAHNYGVDYDRVRKAMVEGYKRAEALPTAGFAAGPCLLKDTMQLVAFYGNNFQLGHAAMVVNEGLPGFIVEDLRKKHDLSKMSVGILGMAFKADIDDIRESLSYKLGKILRFHGAKVYYSDEYAKDPTFVSKENAVGLSDIVIIGVPHSAYKNLAIPKKVEVVDLWGVIKREPAGV
jgi:UDP-N-acetyl-D-mannosaminuronic acid dehydrogenase